MGIEVGQASERRDESRNHVLHVDGNVFQLDAIEGRMAARAYALAIAATGDDVTAKLIFGAAGREG